MLEDIVGPHGLQYFPVVMTFAVLILVSNLMGFFPLFMNRGIRQALAGRRVEEV